MPSILSPTFRRRPPTYTGVELDRLFAACEDFEKVVFATSLLTGLRKQEVYFLAWRDVSLKEATIRLTGEGKYGFSPKDYEEGAIPIRPDLLDLLKKLPRQSEWVFTNAKGGRMNHLLRRLKGVADSETIPAPCDSSSQVGGHLALKSASRELIYKSGLSARS